MNIHQLQATYLVEQDRILIRMNTQSGEELRLWLTRHMLKNLFPLIEQAAVDVVAPPALVASHDGADRRTLAEFKKQEVLQQADFSTPFNSQPSVLPIGAEPLLATSVHMTPTEQGSLRLAFEETLPGSDKPRGFQVSMGPGLLPGFMHLLEQALKQADWGFALGGVSEIKETQTIDAFAQAQPSKYLN